MLTVTKTGPTRIDVTMKGEVDADVMRRGLDELIAQAEGISRGRMLFEAPEFVMPSPGAIGVELARLPKLLGLIRRFDRAAMVSDSEWLRRTAELEGAVIPGLEVKAFPLKARDEAEAWLDTPAI